MGGSDLSELWSRHIESHKFPSKLWHVKPEDDKPSRMKQLTSKALKYSEEEMSVTSPWTLSRRKGDEIITKPILTTDRIPDEVIRRWDLIRGPRNKKTFARVFAKDFEGTREEDIIYILNLIEKAWKNIDTQDERLSLTAEDNEKVGESGSSDLPQYEPCINASSVDLAACRDTNTRLQINNIVGEQDIQTANTSSEDPIIQQQRLFNDPRRHKLLEEYYSIISDHATNTNAAEKTHIVHLAEVVVYIFEHAAAAVPWVYPADGLAQDWQPDQEFLDADYILVTNEQLIDLHNRRLPLKMTVIRDATCFRSLRQTPTSVFIDEYLERPQPDTLIDVQRLEKGLSQCAVERIPMKQAKKEWKSNRSNKISVENPPLNMLNLSDISICSSPPSVYKIFSLLNEALYFTDLHAYTPWCDKGSLTMGKKQFASLKPSDMKQCCHLRIVAQRGAVSSWHIDQSGVFTYLTMQRNGYDNEANDTIETLEDAVKYWAFYPLHRLINEDKKRVLESFGDDRTGGVDWRPDPPGGIPIISLVAGDTLVQPPGTIHAPISLTDSSFVGGMGLTEKYLLESIKCWAWLCDHSNATNEDPPLQTQTIITYLQEEAERLGMADSYEGGREQFECDIDLIYGSANECTCATGCRLDSNRKLSCFCALQGLHCGWRCHRKRGRSEIRSKSHAACRNKRPGE